LARFFPRFLKTKQQLGFLELFTSEIRTNRNITIMHA
jgi:hypothetical protein